MKQDIPVIETFLSLQGEGPSVGEPAFFLRLANCNLWCSWCDTRHSWDWDRYDKKEEVENVALAPLLDRLEQQIPAQVHLLIVTGGEPLLHQEMLTALLSSLRRRRPDVRVEMETNGTITPSAALTELIHLFVVSPKLANSSVNEKRRIRPRALNALSHLPSVLKFVVEAPDEIAEAVAIAAAHGFDASRTWVMPQTTSATDIGSLIAAITPSAIAAGVKVSSRLHVLAWGDARGT